MPDPIDISRFISRSGEQVIKDIFTWQTAAFNAIFQANPHLSQTLRNSGEVPLFHLPIKEQIRQMAKLREASGFNEVMLGLASMSDGTDPSADLAARVGSASRASGVHNIATNLTTLKGLDEEAPLFKIPVSYMPGDNPLNAYYSAMNIQFDPKVRPVRSGIAFDELGSATSASHYGFGTNRIRTISPESLAMPSRLREGATFTSFDIETAGLMRGQIREVAYRQGVVGAGGSLSSVGASNKLLFDPLAIRRGTIGQELGNKIGAVPLGEFINQGETVSDDFARAMVPFLQSVKASDHLIGHNIARFDIPQVIEQLTNTAAYKDQSDSLIPGFRALVDTAFSGIDAKVVDTLTLASRASNLTGLGVASELARVKSFTPYSISNILLQTDLAQHIGIDEVKNLIQTKGLHSAEVDDKITRGLLEHLHKLNQVPIDDQGLRSSILASAAITPFTDAAVHTDISDKALKHLIANVKDGIYTPDNTLASLLERAREGDTRSANAAFKMIRASGKESGLTFKINPIEQQVFETRRLGLGIKDLTSIDPSSYIFNTNLYDKAAYQGLGKKRNYGSLVYGQRTDISRSEFAALQHSLNKADIPFAGVSREERRFGTAISHLTRGVDGRRAISKIENLTTDLQIGTFNLFDPNAVDYVARSGRASVPANLLKQAGLLEEGSLLDLSIVNKTGAGSKDAVALVHKFTAEHAEAFAKNLENLAQGSDESIAAALGFDPELTDESVAEVNSAVSRFRKAVNEGGLPKSIREAQSASIGQIYGDDANPIIEAMGEFSGGTTRDTERLAMRLPLAGIETIDGQTATGVVRTAGAILDEGLSTNDLGRIGKHVQNAVKIFEGFVSFGKDTKNRHILDAANMAADMNSTGAEVIKKAFNAYQQVRGHIPVVAGAAAASLLALHVFKKHRENRPYNEAFDQMPANDNRRYAVAQQLQDKIDSGMNLSLQKYDPLSTAYVVDNLNSSKIGHTNMSWNRDNSLYGGVF